MQTTATSPEMLALIERARQHKPTPQEVFEQRVSWVYGEHALGGGAKTKDEIRQMLIEMQGSPV
jgi:hypothetical protein